MHFMWNMTIKKQNKKLTNSTTTQYTAFAKTKYITNSFLFHLNIFHLYLRQLHKNLCILRKYFVETMAINHDNSSTVFVLWDMNRLNRWSTVLRINLDILKSTLTCKACWDILTYSTHTHTHTHTQNYMELWNRVTIIPFGMDAGTYANKWKQHVLFDHKETWF